MLVHLTVLDNQKQREPAEMFNLHKQDAYVLSEISKTVFKFFLAQISSQLQSWFLQRCGTTKHGMGPPKTVEIVQNL